MAVPTLISDLSTVAASNSPAGSDAVFPDLDNYLRAYAAFIAQLNANKANLASPTFTGTVTTGGAINMTGASVISNSSSYLGVQASGELVLDSANVGGDISFRINSVQKAILNSAGVMSFTAAPQSSVDASSSNDLVRKSQMDTADNLRCLKSSNLSDVANTATALSNLGGVASSSFTGANQSLGASGYQKLPGGLIIQWGLKTGNISGFTVTFPTAFSSACYCVVGQCAYFNANAFSTLSITGAPSTTGFSGYMTNNSSGGHTADDLFWIAIGV